MAEQINVFVENKPGRLNRITRILGENNINMRAIVIADRENYGIVKILVSDPRKAHLLLSEEGFACALKKVLAVSFGDTPGSLYQLTETLSGVNVNIIDAYGFVIESSKEAVLCIEVKDYQFAKTIVEKNGYRILSDDELYEL
ncbi:ACT domain-containing protein [Chitinispirillales bacterium ANBcel5]|uniref:ACT domain-containing protein n=1 Tax=Cellulosispirillum alkaliphilum TaxID=3039283 RepID=UPI002A5771A0|nr:ACT domain-containing protein [Chitinispirillales bacterium ANBcel5]